MTEFPGVVPALAGALTARGYAQLTPVQEAVLAPAARDGDLLVSAQTGSGKTVAFGLALAHTLLGGADRFPLAVEPLALVVAPTRELALQVRRELDWLYAPTGARLASCVGGMDMRDERRLLAAGSHIVVGTPGRLRDHIERGSLDMSAMRAVVLDEADEMLDLGFRDDLEFILDAAPETRRTLMFSATVPRQIATLAKRFQRDAHRISTVRDSEQHLDIEYRAVTVAPNDRENAIINVLRFHDAVSAMVFCGTREGVKHLAARLGNRGFSVVALSGELSQDERTHALQAMRDGRARVCVATDVAARGIDLPSLDLVIHADLPANREGLLHRSGRTGRAGRKGVCAIIVPHTKRRVAERLLGAANIRAEWNAPPSAAEIAARDSEKILNDVVLGDAATEEELTFARALIERHGPEPVAVAYLRQARANQPAAEELIEAGAPPEAARAPKDTFTDGVWFRVALGRKHNAEARWILPMICRAGHITRREVGAIRVHETESHFEIAASAADKFLEAAERASVTEKTIKVTRLEGQPATPAAPAVRTFQQRTPGAASAEAAPRKPWLPREGAAKKRFGAGGGKSFGNSKRPKPAR